MRYKNLHELIDGSKSSRIYFLSLPVKMQLRLHEYGDYISSAEQLHRCVYNMSKIHHIENLTL